MNIEKWLEARGLDIETATKYGVRQEGEWIAFPYLQQGKEIYRKLRSMTDKNFRCAPTGVPQNLLWNEDCLAEAPAKGAPLIITEGEMDCLAILQAGFHHVVSVPSGAKMAGQNQNVTRFLGVQNQNDGQDGPKIKPTIEPFSKIILAVDCDAAGLELRRALAEFLEAEFCWVPAWPEGCKDANDVLRIHGIDALRRLITEAVPIADDGFQPFLDALNTPRVEPLSLGIPWLENHLIPVRPEFMVIGGQAGHGKSTIVQFLLYSLLHKNPELKASIFHGEGDKHILVERARKFYAGVVMPKVFDETFQRDRDLWVNDKLAFINSPQDVMPTFDWLLGTMERQALHRGRTVFVIDPWNEIILAKPVGQSTTEHVAECIIRMKKLADRHKLILIVAHHVAKPSDFNHPPNRYHLSDSQHWANKADHIVLVWKPNEAAEATHINVAKSKDFDRMGRPGEVWVEMVRDTFTFRTVDDPRAKKPTVEERKANAEKAAAEAMDRPASPDPSGGGSSANGHPSFD